MCNYFCALSLTVFANNTMASDLSSSYTAPPPAGYPPLPAGYPPYAPPILEDDIPPPGNTEEPTPPLPHHTSKFKKFLRGVKAIVVMALPHIRSAIIQYGPMVLAFIIELFA